MLDEIPKGNMRIDSLVAIVCLSFNLICFWQTAKADVNDGGFETPSTNSAGVFPSGIVAEPNGSSFGGLNNNAWTVVELGATSGSASLVPSTDYSNGSSKVYYNSHSGAQWLDLTDSGNGKDIGIQQAVATIPGATYTLDFSLGHFIQDNVTAQIALQINGINIGGYGNAVESGSTSYNGDGVTGIYWIGGGYHFVPTSNSTTLTFYDGSQPGVSLVGLDDISFTTTTVPEPRSVFALGIIAALTGLLRPRGQSKGTRVRPL